MSRKSIKRAKTVHDLPTAHFPVVQADIAKETDRGAAILGAAYVDLFLRSAIERRLRPIPDVVPGLFEDRGPLQEFSTRIHLGFALGIYLRRAFDDLRLVRDIRNAFAHNVEMMNFEEPDVRGLCDQLWLPKHIQMRGYPDPTTGREKFVRAVEWLIDGLFRESSVKPLPPPKPIFLNFDAPVPATSSPGKSPKLRPSRQQTQKRS
jgi:hypothetical protein